jgi:hypothetical protein
MDVAARQAANLTSQTTSVFQKSRQRLPVRTSSCDTSHFDGVMRKTAWRRRHGRIALFAPGSMAHRIIEKPAQNNDAQGRCISEWPSFRETSGLICRAINLRAHVHQPRGRIGDSRPGPFS